MAKGNQKLSEGSNLNFEAQLWAAADKMRGHMDASEYKHVCLGLIFLKYISDAFEEKREQPRKSEVRMKKEDGLTRLHSSFYLQTSPVSEWFIKDEPQRAEAAENRDFFSLSASIGERAGVRCRIPQLPPEARWHTIKAKAKSPEIGKVIDEAMIAIERENPTLKGVLPRDYARPSRVEVERKNDEGRKRPEGTHQTVCAANHSFVRKSAENDGSAGSRQTAFAVGNIRRRELPGSALRTKQSRVHRQVRRLSAGVGGISLLAGTAGRGRNRSSGQARATATGMQRTDRDFCDYHQTSQGVNPVRHFIIHHSSFILSVVRRAYRHLRHDHQTREGIRKSEVRMQNAEVATSSFILPLSALISLPSSFILQTLTSPRNADSFRADLHPDLKADFILANHHEI
jgi:hypothetical protein